MSNEIVQFPLCLSSQISFQASRKLSPYLSSSDASNAGNKPSGNQDNSSSFKVNFVVFIMSLFVAWGINPRRREKLASIQSNSFAFLNSDNYFTEV